MQPPTFPFLPGRFLLISAHQRWTHARLSGFFVRIPVLPQPLYFPTQLIFFLFIFLLPPWLLDHPLTFCYSLNPTVKTTKLSYSLLFIKS